MAMATALAIATGMAVIINKYFADVVEEA